MMRNLFKFWAETDYNLLMILESECHDGQEMLMQNFITYRLLDMWPDQIYVDPERMTRHRPGNPTANRV